MIMPYWMHWFWITFFVISSIQVSNSYPSYNSTYNKLTTLISDSSISTSTVKYDDLLPPTNSTRNTTTVIINNNETTVKESRTPKAIDTMPKQLQQIVITPNITKVLHANHTDIHENVTASMIMKSDDMKMIGNHSDLTDLSFHDDIMPNSTLIIAVDKKISNETMYRDEVASNVTDPLTLTLANDQKRKEFIIDDNEVTPTDAIITVQEKVGASTDLIESRENSKSIFTVATITGASFGVLIFAVLIGGISFIVYRRRYLNKPQSLNDKSSNLDSSGYIDDSTMRENSEEMYSLDNDSFLNSLEAMTIQNYWTDNVKHTKL